jgi:hypothetical protein
MENETNIPEGRREAKAMDFSAQSVVYLNETRKWTIFLSILGFIFLGLMVIMAIFAGTFFSSMSGGMAPAGTGIFLSIIYLLMAVLYFFPILYLYKFSVHSKRAIYGESTDELTLAFKNLKSHYKFMGILTIVLLSIYLLAFLLMGIMGGVGAFM